MLVRFLDWIGLHASKSLPAGLVIGLLFPAAANSLNSFLSVSLIVPLMIGLAKVDWKEAYYHLKRWKLMVWLILWMLVACPIVIWLFLLIIPINSALSTAAVITAAAPPLTACIAIAIFMKLDAAIVVVATVETMLIVPLTLPPITLELSGIIIEKSAIELSLFLAAFIFTAFIIALVTKKTIGEKRLKKYSHTLDGIAVIFISCFIVGIMDGVTAIILERPVYVLITLLFSTGFVIFTQIISAAIFWKLPRKTSLAIAMMCGNCNLGLVYLLLVDQASIDLLLFFSVGQIPMYLLPALQTPIYQRLLRSQSSP